MNLPIPAPDNEKLFFPTNQADTSWQPKANNLLAREIYSALERFISERVEGMSCSNAALNEGRQHDAILIDGPRGSGKSSVLVNLKKYLEEKNPALLKRVYIFAPVDPTLLEEHDDLFLNVVVAAVLSSSDVKAALNVDSPARTQLHKQLQRLGHALHNMQSQRDRKGIDKIRAFIGNQELIEEVHRFFDDVRKLLGKDLLILPIDDVDTSLNRAFENMEVVRRYLTTPLVLPVISGDASLYLDVAWRDFHRRLTKDSSYDRKGAYERAVKLADEYQRKVLPLQYRLAMPPVSRYFERKPIPITLGEKPDDKLTLPVFYEWLKVLLNDRTNGLENSELRVPVYTVRALAQLTNRLRYLIPSLEKAVRANGKLADSLRHYVLMPDVTPEAIQAFAARYQGTDLTGSEADRRKTRDDAYTIFDPLHSDTYVAVIEFPGWVNELNLPAWVDTLCEHIRYDPAGGAVYLVLLAMQAWRQDVSLDNRWRSVFDTPLFQPLQQAHDPLFAHFQRGGALDDWRNRLTGRAPEVWLAQLPGKTILPYPAPEIGPLVSSDDKKAVEAVKADAHARLLFELVMHRNFYRANKAGAVVCIGRIFEIIVTSLLRDVSEADIQIILHRAPFLSFSDVAGTKTLSTPEDDGGDEFEEYAPATEELGDAARDLASAINGWRSLHSLSELRLSPWLVYNVMNKVYNQAWYFNSPQQAAKSFKQPFDGVVWVARKAFNSIWAAFGSFEKGRLYGLPEIIAVVNVGDGKDFQRSDLYRQNITPFVGESSGASRFGSAIRAITYFLNDHPLKMWTENLNFPGRVEKAPSKQGPSAAAKGALRAKWLKDNLGSAKLGVNAEKRLKALGHENAMTLRDDYEKLFSGDNRLRRMIAAIF